MSDNKSRKTQAKQNESSYLQGPCDDLGVKIDLSDAKAKAKQLLLKHPEIMHDARHLFRNENGTTIVEEIVPRGDQGLPEVLNQGDITDLDLKGLAQYAASLVDPCLVRYDERVAFEDALNKAIWEKDSGMYQGKVNANTFCLILDTMMKKAKTASEEDDTDKKDKEKKPEKKKVVQVTDVTRKLMTPEQEAELKGEAKGEAEGVSETDKQKYKKYLEKKEKDDSQETGKQKDKTSPDKEKEMDKEAALKKIEAMQASIEELKKVMAAQEAEEKESSEVDAETLSPIVESLDKIAGELEETGDVELMKVAYGIDTVSDVLDGKKEAKVLEMDLDEKFMKEYFKGGIREGEADEKKYMKQFDNDDSAAVEEVKDKKSRTASEQTKRPYTKID
jgi:hypothetical protein